MRRYKKLIETYFLIDEPKGGKLVPFKFNKVQQKYYQELVDEYDIETNGLQNPVREIILKARREGFSSFVLALFAADDILSENPTETNVISYKDDATKVFRKRYRLYVTSYAARKMGHTVEEIQKSPGLLDLAAKQIFSIDSQEFEIKHNQAHFYCGTASARVGGRGGVVQKLLFSEAAFYPDKQELRAKEIIEGTLRQVDVDSGFVFVESTANGDLNHYYKMWDASEKKESRFKPRFYGWREFYTEEEFELIKSEFTDKRMIPQEYPETPEEAFLSSGSRFFDASLVQMLATDEPIEVVGDWKFYLDYKAGHRMAGGIDIAEGVGRHNSTIVIIDFDHETIHEGRIYKKPKIAAVFASNKIAPDLLAYEIRDAGMRYGNCLMCPERNQHGWATITKLKEIYFYTYRDDKDQIGWLTGPANKPQMMNDLRSAVHANDLDLSDEALKREILSLPADELNKVKMDEEDETRGHFDRVIACALAWQMRSLATPAQSFDLIDEGYDKYQETEGNFEQYASPFNEI